MSVIAFVEWGEKGMGGYGYADISPLEPHLDRDALDGKRHLNREDHALQAMTRPHHSDQKSKHCKLSP